MTLEVVKSMTNIDGTICPAEQARIPVLDRGFLYGDSVYEVFRTYQGVPLFMEEHFVRLENSASLVHMNITQSREELTREIKRTVQSTGASTANGTDLYVRYQITRGVGPIDLHPDPKIATRYVIVVAPLKPWKSEFYKTGMTMAIPNVRRNPIYALDPNIKGGNYLNNVIAIMEARKRGADESLILSSDGHVTEASNSNVWFVFGDELATPASGNLRGLTKWSILKACKEQNVLAVERDIHVEELPEATECFVTSATREVMPVYCLEVSSGQFVDFPRGGGVYTKEIQLLYRNVVDRYVKQHAAQSFY